LVADTFNRSNNVQLFRNITLTEKQDMYRHPALKELPDEVGVFTYEISQPSKNGINFTGLLSSKCLKIAKPVD